jgi:ABC-2 type transport system permease protein
VFAEPGHSWHLRGAAVVLSVWLVLGLVVATRTFRWVRERRA